MQAVILASGRGTRMGTLTDTIPKPMLRVHGKSLIELKLEALPEEVDEVILVVGYLGDVIRNTFGDSFKGRSIRYVEQETLNGTAAAVWLAAPLLTERFIILMGDDLYSREDMQACMDTPGWSILIERTETMASGGSMVMDPEGNIVGIEEGDHTGKPGLMNTNLFVLDPSVFKYPMIPKSEGSHEYGLPQTVVAASLTSGIPLTAVEATSWIQVTAPEDLQKAEALLPR